jgi:cell division septation protein DedD
MVLVLHAAGARAAQTGGFTVRSAPYVGRSEAVAFTERLGERGFHPVIRTEQSKGEEFYYLEMGVFNNMDQALELVFLLRGQNFDFFVVGAENTGGETARGALVQPDKMARIFPGQAGPAVDQISLLENIVVNEVPSPDQARTWTGGTGPDSGFITSRRMFQFQDTGPQAPDVTDVAMRLRDIAWSLRSEGRDVVFEGEAATTQSESGVLVGMYETRAQADALAGELRSYGYDILVQQYPTADGERFLIYAQADDTPSEISNNDIPKPTADSNILKLTGPRRGNTISPPTHNNGPITYPQSPIGE